MIRIFISLVFCFVALFPIIPTTQACACILEEVPVKSTLSLKPNKKIFVVGETIEVVAETKKKGELFPYPWMVDYAFDEFDGNGEIELTTALHSGKYRSTGTFVPTKPGSYRLEYEMGMEKSKTEAYVGRGEIFFNVIQKDEITVYVTPKQADISASDELFILLRYAYPDGSTPKVTWNNHQVTEVPYVEKIKDGFSRKLYRFSSRDTGEYPLHFTISQNLKGGSKREKTGDIQVNVIEEE